MNLSVRNWFWISYVSLCYICMCDGFLLKTLEAAQNLLFNTKEQNRNSNCKNVVFLCSCGHSNETVRLQVPQCIRYQRFKAKCGICDGMTPSKICPIFHYCTECTSDEGGHCTKCAKGRYGNFCEKECFCENNADCNEDGSCLCSPGFTGELCEKKTGCDPPATIAEPVQAEFRPPSQPTTIVYKCPSDYEMEGVAIATCKAESNTWSSPPPSCLARCGVLSNPANGHLNYSKSRLMENVTADVICDENYHVTGGDSVLVCQADGKWKGTLPLCDELKTCNDPGNVPYAKRTISRGRSAAEDEQPKFWQGTELHYSCQPQFQQLGPEKILCQPDGSWSRHLPTCVLASPVLPTCETKGNEISAEFGVPVRILCPPECASKPFDVFGTSIYRMNSSICASAIHSGKLTNSGGLVGVINNGDYTHFSGSNMNNILSKSFAGRDKSFRFDKVNAHSQPGHCPRGLEKLEETCVYIASYSLAQKEAHAICTNLGMRLGIPDSEADSKHIISILPSKGINKIWTANFVHSEISNDSSFNQPECESAQIHEFQLTNSVSDCDEQLYYVCIYDTSNLLASCVDPGPLENGAIKPIGKVDDTYFVGASIEYSCEMLHYLKGADTIYCNGNGTWSHDKPVCIRVDTCEDPPIPTGGFVNYLAPTTGQAAQRSAVYPAHLGSRMGRLPHGLGAIRPPSAAEITSTTPSPESRITLPAGRHRIGTRAMYDCESRYYSLVGSRTRRCEGKGTWSGRPPTCMPICGRSDSPRTPFIVNGNATDIGQWPWQAGLARYIPDYDLWYLICGGSLLSERWVITAAHCVTYSGTTIPIDLDKFRIYLGKYHRSDSEDDEYVQVKTIKEMYIHPDYEPQIYDADIALLSLETPVQLNTRVQPVCLPTEKTTDENLKTGQQGVVTGWGMNENQSNSNTLQQAVVPVISNEECEKGYQDSDLHLSVTDNMVCAGYEEGRVDSCSGDSGGPLVFLDQSAKQRKWVLEGIVSWGSPNGCGQPNQFGGYTRVSKFLDWIYMFV